MEDVQPYWPGRPRGPVVGKVERPEEDEEPGEGIIYKVAQKARAVWLEPKNMIVRLEQAHAALSVASDEVQAQIPDNAQIGIEEGTGSLVLVVSEEGATRVPVRFINLGHEQGSVFKLFSENMPSIQNVDPGSIRVLEDFEPR